MWRTKKLNQVCDIQSGLWKGKKEPFTEAYVLRNTNFTAGGKFDYTDVALLQVETKQLEKRTVLPNDIILEKSGGGEKTPVGRVCLHTSELDKPVSLSNFTARLRVINEEELIPSFLHRFLYFLYISGKTEPMQRNSTGIRNLQISQYKDIEVPLPPLAEQRRIVAKLDAAFAEIDEQIVLTERKVESIENLRETVLVKLFDKFEKTAPKKLLKDVCCEFARGKSKHRPRNDERLYGDKIPFVQTGDVSGAEKYLKQFNKKYSDFGIQQSKIWQKGTVCITIAANIAELAILEMDACFPDSVIGAMPDVDVTSSEYLYYLLNFYQKKIKAKSKGSAQQNINLGTFADEQFPFPSLQEQILLVENLSKIERQIDNVRQIASKKIGHLKSLKSAMLLQQMQSEAA